MLLRLRRVKRRRPQRVQLNPYQCRAIAVSGHCTILACPGSGKTTVLAKRASNLLLNEPNGRLFAVTFTKDAASDLKKRILAECLGAGNRIVVGTFHSLAYSQLKSYLRPLPKLINDGSRRALLRRCYVQHETEIPFENIASIIDDAKSRLGVPVFKDEGVQNIYAEYCDILKSENAMDFSDIILMAVRMMHERPETRLPGRWMLADELQDMDNGQMEWLLSHGRNGVEITGVGDDDQSLYSFRSALGYEGLNTVTAQLSSTEMTLPINYRCPPNILGCAAKLIWHNKERADKKIAAHKTVDGEFHILRCADRFDEFDRMVQKIMAHKNDWAVLARTNTILDSAEVALVGAGISCIRVGGKSIWEYSIGSVFMGLMRSVVDDSWTGVANVLVQFGLRSTLINQHSKDTTETESGCIDRLYSLKMMIEERKDSDSSASKAVNALYHGFLAWNKCERKGMANLIIYGIAEHLSSVCKNEKQLKFLETLKSAVLKIPGSLKQKLTLIGMNLPDTREPPYVQLMTVHGSKGLEFENVWIMAVEEGNLPHTDAREEDERRLLYVGMTRTKNRLILSSSIEDGMESRFLFEAGLAR